MARSHPTPLRRADERGSITVWMASSTVAMILLVGLAVDLGGAVHAQQRAQDLAAHAARAGGEQIDTASMRGRTIGADARAAKAAAQAYLRTADVSGTVTTRGGTTLDVYTSDTYQPLFLTYLGISRIPVTGHANARIARALDGSER